MDYIEPIKSELESKMHEVCLEFLSGKKQSLATPRYYNFGEFDNDSKVLTIQSTQYHLWEFKVQTQFNFIDVTEFWEQFKKFRTEFLLENYPTINVY